MYFPDLTPFNARRVEYVAVGWLSREHPFPRGESPPAFVKRLAKLVEVPCCLTLGLHRCEFCDKHPAAAGNGQIHLPHGAGRWYCAPQLIHHYVVAHSYRAPDEFITAVLCAPPSAFKPPETYVGACPECRRSIRLRITLNSRPRSTECTRCDARLVVEPDERIGFRVVSATG
jgi:hypothetical protein